MYALEAAQQESRSQIEVVGARACLEKRSSGGTDLAGAHGQRT